MHPRQFPSRLALAAIFVINLTAEVRGQLAITEVMAVAAKENATTAWRRPDFWELTNFGTNDINLHGYGFRDSRPTRPLTRSPFDHLIIRAGESIIFFQRERDPKTSVTNLARFRAWWGESRVPAHLQCQTWEEPGLSGWDGDAVWLYDAASNLVDVVQFGRARLGRTFTHEPETGIFGSVSVAGLNGAFAAELGEDVGSPGITTGAVPVHFLQQPLDQLADVGTDVRFTVAAAGLPHPRYQWFARGVPIPGGTGPTLVISNVQPSSAGAYHVRITNGLSAATSTVAALTVNTNPLPPTVVTPLADIALFNRQTAIFEIAARGQYLKYQWQADGVDVPNATGSTLEIANVSESQSGTRYSVRIWNDLGSTNTSALLTVARRPDLRFTEIMARPADEEDNGHFDWFELTNFDTNAINLQGWRFSDEPSLARAFTITNALILQPGESAVFAERLDARLFAVWWGADGLPENFKLCTYSGFGLAYLGETLSLWNPAAIDPHDPVAIVSWAEATPGVSFQCEHWCDPEGYGCLDYADSESTLGVRGTFRAVNGGDLGSPGWMANPTTRILSAGREAGGAVTLRCRVTAGVTYRLRRSPSVSFSAWTPLRVQTATNNVITLTDEVPETGPTWFYRVEEIP